MVNPFDNGGLAEVPFVFSRFRGEYVTGKGMSPLYLTCAGLFETLGGASVCLDLWHC